ncbi:hypothetical protein BKA67DRAFT_586009 [Truncatella angustata]|uniref:Uncharacterized protein n=1 Tax=Truncatella angustata TaxID=152316 RepID=A0A9P8RGL9_9PEZI|nr:uncharacterized protein BKA67DRAFT_586009 [Truncatella angustata]KAH6645653.1 hypothetical protein BKA67DRAFT_586009 [Truncatella angustata]
MRHFLLYSFPVGHFILDPQASGLLIAPLHRHSSWTCHLLHQLSVHLIILLPGTETETL